MSGAGRVLCALGDLLEDVVVWLGGPIASATDTPARTFRRRGGSSANVAAFAAAAGRPARFIGQVGDDGLGRRLVEDLRADGVDVRVRWGGHTGTVVVLVEADGERSMITDRGSAPDLRDVPDDWVADVGALHLTAYALTAEPVATTARHLAAVARSQGALLSVDASSVAVLERYGIAQFRATLGDIGPDLLLANEAEAEALGLREASSLPPGVALAVVKRGPQPARLVPREGRVEEVPAVASLDVADTTGAGDAFAAGVLDALLAGADPGTAVGTGHRWAAGVLRQPGATRAGGRQP